MRNQFFLFMICSALFIDCSVRSNGQPVYVGTTISDKNAHLLLGSWHGTLKVTDTKRMNLVFNFNKDSTGKYIATMDSPDQGARGITINGVTFSNDSLIFRINRIRAVYTGLFNKAKHIFKGKWQQGEDIFDLDFKKGDKLNELVRTQVPKAPFPYTEENIEYTNHSAGVTIAGTLTLPKKDSKKITIFLLAGSGKNNRDATHPVLKHSPMLVLADYLGRQGYSVLRVDKRGVGESNGNYDSATMDDFQQDVELGLQFLRQHKKLQNHTIGLIGHSEGGIIAPRIASIDKDIAFVVMLAGAAAPLDDLLQKQIFLMAKASGLSDKELSKLRKTTRTIIGAIKNNPQIDKPNLDKLLGKEESYPMPVERLLTPYLRNFLHVIPKNYLVGLKCPTLALFGSLDLQVAANMNVGLMRDYLKQSNSEFEVVEWPDKNHLFQSAKKGTFIEMVNIEETISPQVLNKISEWISNLK